MAISKAYSTGNKPNEYITPVDFGAAWDGVTDDTGAMQSFVDYCGVNNCIGRLPPGSGRFSNVQINTEYQGLSIIGSGRRRTTVGTGCTVLWNNSTTPMFQITGSGTITGLTLDNFSYKQVAATGGELLTSTNSMSECHVKRLDWTLQNTTKRLIDIDAVSISNCKFEDHYGVMAATTTVSPYYIKSGTGGSYFGNTFSGWFINSNNTTTAPVLRLDDSSGGATNGGNRFEELIFELCANGGAIHASSLRNSTFERVFCDDSGSNAAHLIHLDKNATVGSQESAYNTFIGCVSDEGTSTWKDLYIESSGPGSQTVLIGCRLDYIDIEGPGYTSINNQVISDLSGQQPTKIFSGNLTVPTNSSITLPSGHTVPEMESGVTGTVGAGGSRTVSFGTTFSSAPNVVVSHTAGTSRDGPLTVTGISTTGFTVHNWATAASTAQWIATN